MSDWGLDPSLFGKVYSYEDLLHVQRPGRAAKPHTTLKERPANWPANVEVDTVSRWAFWLPEGWAQGINTTVSGKTLKCYMTPEGKRFFHKKDIEKFIGRVLPSWEPPQPKEGQEKAVKSVSDPDAIPHWPEEGWLPKEWFLAFRQLPSGLHRIYIPPGQREGFCYHRSTVMEYLSGENTRLSPFGTSRAMAEISANAAYTGTRAAKRHKSSTSKQASLDDYESSSLALAPVLVQGTLEAAAARLSEAGASEPEELASAGREVHSLLLKRRFPEETELVAVLHRSSGGSGTSAPRLVGHLCGLYYCMPEAFAGRPCYQSVLKAPGQTGLACKGLYIFWSAGASCWKLGALTDSKAGFAFSSDDQPRPMDVKQPWLILKESFYGKDSAQNETGKAT